MYKTLLSLCTPCEVRNHYDLDEDHGLQTLPADLGNVKQIILARYNLNERTVRHNRSVIPQKACFGNMILNYQ